MHVFIPGFHISNIQFFTRQQTKGIDSSRLFNTFFPPKNVILASYFYGSFTLKLLRITNSIQILSIYSILLNSTKDKVEAFLKCSREQLKPTATGSFLANVLVSILHYFQKKNLQHVISEKLFFRKTLPAFLAN